MIHYIDYKHQPGNTSDDNDIFLGVSSTQTISVREVAKILQELYPRKPDFADEVGRM